MTAIILLTTLAALLWIGARLRERKIERAPPGASSPPGEAPFFTPPAGESAPETDPETLALESRIRNIRTIPPDQRY